MPINKCEFMSFFTDDPKDLLFEMYLVPDVLAVEHAYDDYMSKKHVEDVDDISLWLRSMGIPDLSEASHEKC